MEDAREAGNGPGNVQSRHGEPSARADGVDSASGFAPSARTALSLEFKYVSAGTLRIERWGSAFSCFVLAFMPALSAQDGYVGSKACAPCHRAIYDKYIQTPMGRSMRLATDPSDLARIAATITIPSGDRLFAVRRQGGAIYQDEYQLDSTQNRVFSASFQLEYSVGSGQNGCTYLVRRGNYLMEAPLSYFVRAQKWEVSPGYENENPGFGRTIAAGCIACHSGRAKPVADRDGLYANPPFQELAIGCENCHGPGARHVQETGATVSIVNPARLQPRIAEQICVNCHQAGDTRVLLPGRSATDFVPGQPLGATLAIFKIPLDPAKAKLGDLLEHHFAMQLSKCFRSSKGRLNCLTCHDPHANATADSYRAKCLTCHTSASCPIPRAQRIRQASDRCAECHMPKNNIGIISHSALTDHRIVARRDEALPPEAFRRDAADPPGLRLLDRDGPLPKITLLQAYGELMAKAPQLQPLYLALLDELRESAPENPLVQAALGQKAFLEGAASNAQAIEHLSKAVQVGFTSPSAFENLAEALVRAGRTPEAIEVLKQGIARMTYAPRLYKYLAVRYIDLKQNDRAKETLETYMGLFPDDDFVRGLLRNIEAQH